LVAPGIIKLNGGFRTQNCGGWVIPKAKIATESQYRMSKIDINVQIYASSNKLPLDGPPNTDIIPCICLTEARESDLTGADVHNNPWSTAMIGTAISKSQAQ